MKIDPLTGNTVWVAYVGPSSLYGSGYAGRVLALTGTNDVMVTSQSSSTAFGISRVDSTGAILWTYSGVGYGFSSERQFGVDGSYSQIIVSNYVTSAIQSLSYSGSVNYSYTPAGRSMIHPIVVGPGVAVYLGSTGFVSLDTNGSPSVNWTNNTGPPADGPLAMDSNGDFLGYGYNPSPTIKAQKFSGATGNSLLIPTIQLGYTQFGTAGYTIANFRQVISTGNTGLTPVFTLTSIGGATLASNMYDACSATIGGTVYCFFIGDLMTGTGGTKFNIFCTDASGTLQWVKEYGDQSLYANAPQGCTVSDDGYLYVSGGNVVT